MKTKKASEVSNLLLMRKFIFIQTNVVHPTNLLRRLLKDFNVIENFDKATRF